MPKLADAKLCATAGFGRIQDNGGLVRKDFSVTAMLGRQMYPPTAYEVAESRRLNAAR
jgi:hypothetical protein